MYHRSGLGFSLMPPKWLRTAGAQVFAAAKDSAVSIARERLAPPPAPSLMESVPGGIGTVGLVAAVALGAVLLMRRR